MSSYAQYHILLLTESDTDKAVFTQIFESYAESIAVSAYKDLPDDMSSFHVIVSFHDIDNAPLPVITIQHFPIRIGDIMDRIEAVLFQNPYNQTLTYADYRIESDSLILHHDGRDIPLTETERNIVYKLIEAGEKGLTREAMLASIWAYQPGLETHTLETHIYRLRQKIEPDPANPQYLVTVPDGYTLN